VVADGNMVMVLNQQYRPDPFHKGKYYQTFVFDLLRVQNGKMAEHWDDTTIPAKPPLFLTRPVPGSRCRRRGTRSTEGRAVRGGNAAAPAMS
jgi:hypothetical protein